MNLMTLDDVDINGKKVIIRVDFNVPLTDTGQVRDFTRILAALPTIHNILDYGGAAVLMSHLGRPGGKVVEKYSLRPVAVELERILRMPVKFIPSTVGADVERMVQRLTPGEVLLLENVRFLPGEKENDPQLGAELAKLGDTYVNDAFGAAHRAHASTHAIAKHFPGKAIAGRLMMREIRFLERTLRNPAEPFVGVIGGAKISTKLKTIRRLLGRVDKLLIGGGMAHTLIKAQGGKIGDSLVEDGKLDIAREILASPDAEIMVLPVDVVAARDLDPDSEQRVFPAHEIPDGWRGLDIGPDTRESFRETIKSAGTILWNGPMGLFEITPYAAGTRSVANSIINMTLQGGISVVGGGDSSAALRRFNLQGPMTHVSTGGGSLLEFVEGKPMPALEVLTHMKDIL